MEEAVRHRMRTSNKIPAELSIALREENKLIEGESILEDVEGGVLIDEEAQNDDANVNDEHLY